MRIFDILTEQQLFEALTIDKGSPAANRRFAVDTVLQTEFTNLTNNKKGTADILTVPFCVTVLH